MAAAVVGVVAPAVAMQHLRAMSLSRRVQTLPLRRTWSKPPHQKRVKVLLLVAAVDEAVPPAMAVQHLRATLLSRRAAAHLPAMRLSRRVPSGKPEAG